MKIVKKKSFFFKFGPDEGKTVKGQTYEVQKFINSYLKFSPSVVQSKCDWIGYVAVATSEGVRFLGRRDILVCWRGTVNIEEWKKNINLLPIHAELIYPNVRRAKVHKGFYSIYTESNKKHNKKSARDQVVDEVKELVNKYRDEEVSITITGHSLGAALATLNAADIVSHGYNKEFLVTTFVFGSPKVGNKAFKTEFNKHEKLRLLRVENANDLITKLPPKYYAKVGKEIRFNRTSASLIENGKSIDHSLKNYVEELRALPYRPFAPSPATIRKRKSQLPSSTHQKQQKTSTGGSVWVLYFLPPST
ncbi:phospholipase A1-II 1-like isoform X1 [Mangifera indica]|uniref:phospholipase A1-II 1-like isoform X1 n=1 Tax=Mangifera indica TaxID=29780 RepID=UPI001CFB2BDF|nr:phospholipase A1-II 1-like isoform X1 [Mangifera indica]